MTYPFRNDKHVKRNEINNIKQWVENRTYLGIKYKIEFLPIILVT